MCIYLKFGKICMKWWQKIVENVERPFNTCFWLLNMWLQLLVMSTICQSVCCSHLMSLSNGNISRVTGPLCGEFTGPGEYPTQRPVTRSFVVFFDLRLNKQLSKQPWGWWFDTPSVSLWHQCNDLPTLRPSSNWPRSWQASLTQGWGSAVVSAVTRTRIPFWRNIADSKGLHLQFGIYKPFVNWLVCLYFPWNDAGTKCLLALIPRIILRASGWTHFILNAAGWGRAFSWRDVVSLATYAVWAVFYINICKFHDSINRSFID